MRCLILFFLIFHGISFSQNFTLSGYLEDIETGESLIGANILIDEINIGGSTNNYGFFSLTVPQGNYTIICSYIGYENLKTTINLSTNTSKKFKLTPASFQIDEVKLSSKKEDYNIQSAELGKVELEVKKLDKFFVAEGYHQNYFELNSFQPYCRLVILPKLKKVKINLQNF